MAEVPTFPGDLGRSAIRHALQAATYEVLLNELRLYNPELLDKDRILVVTKNDLLDDELRADIAKGLPSGVPQTFISAVTGDGLMHLKDMIWEALNREV